MGLRGKYDALGYAARMEQLGRRARVRSDASSDLGKHYAGHHGRIEQFAKDPETMVLIRYTIRLDDGRTQLDLHPSEVEILQ
jgi:hypothetical protein